MYPRPHLYLVIPTYLIANCKDYITIVSIRPIDGNLHALLAKGSNHFNLKNNTSLCPQKENKNSFVPTFNKDKPLGNKTKTNFNKKLSLNKRRQTFLHTSTYIRV